MYNITPICKALFKYTLQTKHHLLLSRKRLTVLYITIKHNIANLAFSHIFNISTTEQLEV